MEREKRHYEEYGYVLDFLPRGRAVSGGRYIAEPIIQIIGEEFFTLLEAAARPNIVVNLHERIYIGKEKRDKVSHIIGRIPFEELTPTAKGELPYVVEEIVKKGEARFVEFFNKAQSITPRMHAFELLPGIGKKYMWQIVNEREKRPFESFNDIQNRTGLPDPMKVVAKRILDELMADQKYKLFCR
ncbi:MAG: DUF655 domain-containing protein [Candidatus Bathyarchaeia archaeon]